MKKNYAMIERLTRGCRATNIKKRWLLLVIATICMLGGTQQVRAITLYETGKVTMPVFTYPSEVNQEGYITLSIPVYEDDNNQSWVAKQSNKDYPYLTVNATKFFEFYVEDGHGKTDGHKTVMVKVRPTSAGAGRISIITKNGTSARLTNTSTFAEYEIVSTPQSGYLYTMMQVRVYPSTEENCTFKLWITTKETDTNAGITIRNQREGVEYAFPSTRKLYIPTVSTTPTFTSTWEFSSSKKMNLTGKITGIEKDTYSAYALAYAKWDGNNNYEKMTYPNGAISSKFEVTLDDSNTDKDKTKTIRYYWRQDVEERYSPLYIEKYSCNAIIPAYNQAKGINGSYNQTSGIITLSWTVDTSTHSNSNKFVSKALGGDFHVQRATNSLFNQEVKDYTVPFVANKTSYTLSDTIAGLSNNGTFHYRIRRTLPTSWSTSNWDNNFYSSGTVTGISVAKHATVSSPKLVVDKERSEVVITWTANKNYWSSGSKLIIRKYNVTTKNSLDIELTETQFNSGTYTDQALTACNEYTYQIFVKPGLTFFETQTAINISGSAIVEDIGNIQEFKASKGYFSDRVTLEWTAIGSFNEFIIKRMEYGETEGKQIGTVSATLSETYSFDDDKGIAGVYYTYSIIGTANCNNVMLKTPEKKAIGFRTPTGNIYGRVTFSSGQPVGNVEIRLNSELDLGKSIKLTNSTVLQVPEMSSLSNDNFTFQTWAMSESATKPTSMVLFSKAGQYEVGFNNSGDLYFTAGTATVSAPYKYVKNEFIHISAIKKEQTLKIYLDTIPLVEEIKSGVTPVATLDTLYLGSNETRNKFIGYLDEVRIWNRALEFDEIKRDYSRLIVGNETDIIAYYRFDETMANEFYDISYKRTKYNENHGIIKGGTTDTRSSKVPENLGLKGITDNSGDYYINGVPYEGNGTQYKVIPWKGTHQFDPEYRLRNLSDSEQTVEANFTNKSSFNVSGEICYENTNIPVQGVTFKIDGTYVSDGKGGMAQSNTKGEFNIEVPVGVHTVQAIKDGHTFNNDGLIQFEGKDINYQDHRSGIEIWDITKVRFIGRVAGGAVEESFKVGHSLSTNNLGDNLVIKLAFIDGDKFDPDNIPKSTFIEHLLPSNKKNETPKKTKIEYEEKAIYIYPDEGTGEFFVDLIPHRFKIESVSALGHENNILKESTSTPTLNLQNCIVEMDEVYEYMDSVNNEAYSDTVKYHYKEQFIKRVPMEIDFYQVNKKGSRTKYFGEEEIEFTNLFGDAYTVPIYANDKYLFSDNNGSIPVFLQGHQYNYVATASEVYRYNGSLDIKDEDRVPCVDGSLVVINKIATESTEISIRLNSKGHAFYSFVAGVPDMGSSATNSFSAQIKLTNNEKSSWTFEGKEMMNAYTIGSKSKGSDFVTEGPKQLITVLRDPPGSNSYAYLEKGTVITSTSTSKHGVKQTGEEDIRAVISPEFKSAAGTPFFMTITEIKTDNSVGGIVEHEQSSYDGETTTKRTTLTTRFETSSDPLYVGRDGDVLIGNSTNIVYGMCDAYIIVDKSYEMTSTDDLVMEADNYKLIRRSSYNSDVQFKTMFAYPQVHIENRLIPELVDLKNSYLQYGTQWTPDVAQKYANDNGETVYVSYLSREDENFGKSNNDEEAFSNANKTVIKQDGPSYRIYYPEQMPKAQQNDTIFQICSSIQNWYNLLAQNERSKLRATKMHQNYSFHAGSLVEYSEEYSFETETTYEYDYFVGASAILELGATFNGVGFKTTFREGGFEQGASSTSNATENTRKEGFVLAENGDDDYLTVDVLYEESENLYEKDATGLTDFAKGPFVYRTRGGVTSCPYEPVRYTKYYQPGTVLDQATVQLEVPVLSSNLTSVVNVPQSRPAVFTLYLENQSEAKEDNYFTLAVLDGSNPYGAKLSIDGQALTSSGRAFLVPFGEQLVKTLEFRVGADSMRYENVQLILRSICQYDPTDFVENIADTISLSAYFIPSCSDVNIKTPLENFIVNTKSPKKDDVYQLPVVLDGFDVNNQSLDRIEIQMKQEDESEWFAVQTYFTNPTRINNPDMEAEFDRTKSTIEYNIPMNRYDSRYQIRAVSICVDGQDEISTFSQIVTGTKDTERPKLFGTPQPANGILDVEGEIRIDFNETIKEGALSRYNFQVTGIKNGSTKTHGVSVAFDGINDYLATEAERNLVDRDLTIEMWVYRERGTGAATLFSHGNINNSLEFGFTADDKLTVQMNGTTHVSNTLSFETGTQWAHVAMVYNATNETVSLFYNATTVLSKAAVGKYEGNGIFEFGRSIKSASNFFEGKIHEVRLWGKQLTSSDLKINWLRMYSGLESGMIAYYPMLEGKGNMVYDKVRGANATMYAEWSTQEGRAISFAGDGIVMIPSAEISKEMDYTIELWFNAAPGQTNATLVSNEVQQAGATLSNTNRFFLGFNENGKLTFRSNEREEIIEDTQQTDLRDNNWHHIAISVNRVTRRMEAFIDGALIKQFNIEGIEGMSADQVTIGGTRILEGMTLAGTQNHFTGIIDEVRFWNGAMTEDLVNSNNNSRLNGDEMGLIGYYPFEEYKTENNITSVSYTLQNKAVSDEAPKASTATKATETSKTAPIKDRGPVENLKYSYVISDKSLIINLDEDMDVIEKSTVTFSVKQVLDMFGNETVSPITWSAYIDRNLLKWSTDEINLSKQRNEPLSFTADVVNNGGSIERFTLENLPVWLTASPMTGSINPKAKQTIKFTVNEGTNVGTYQEMVFMLNSKGVSEALPVNLRVKGEIPEWTVNPADYEYSMSVFGKLRINNIFSSDAEDIFAAFINGKCVGVATNKYQDKTNTWYAFLTVYGNKEMVDAEVEFRIWDAGTGIIYGAETTQAISFKNQKIYGTAENPLIFDSSNLVYQNIKLNKGWNWISFNVTNNALNDVQTTLQNSTWTANDIVKNENYFDSYSAVSKTWTGTLSNNGGFNNTSMYMLNSGNNQMLSIIGETVNVKNTPVAVKGNKWNYISYLPSVNMKIDDALADYDAKSGDVIKSQTTFAMFDGYAWIGSLSYMEPGKGYMLLRNDASDTNFRYPQQIGSITRTDEEVITDANYAYASNMTMTAIVDENTEFREGDKLVALINGEVRGIGTCSNNGLNYLNIASDEAGVIAFGIERNGNIIAQATSKEGYIVNKVAGSPEQPILIDFTERAQAVTLYPNPFVTDLNICITLNESAEVGIIINDISGRLVTQWSSQYMEAGSHTITWSEAATAHTGTQYIVTVTINGKASSHKVTKK
ncbi:T9SS C-terminal target domain-containing protein [Bacteroides sp. 214]|uniref:LamG-like jellyroll fold domain-containing protein n=1 Tax=Bacteroides sp. 214 TaxID=2302935 RepID=UPI0013D75F42|nr:LamG-like jellyroll fold domain-containing protein [Bacteroides sp. 214]NDW12077.1 T9SS C-terminal target domain-containing protein [Bacteroides sp. 214]